MKNLKFILSIEMLYVLFIVAGAVKMMLNLPFDFTVFVGGILIVVTLFKFLKKLTILRISLLPLACIGIFTIILVLSIMYSPSTVYAHDKAIRFLLTTLPAFVIPLLIFRSKHSLEKIIKSIYFISIVLGLIGFIVVLKGGQTENGFVELGGDNYISVARVLGMGGVISFTYMVYSSKIKLAFTHFIILAIIGFPLISTGGRMPFIAFVLSSLLMLVLYIKFSKREISFKSVRKFLMIISLLSIGIWLIFRNSIYATSFKRITVLFTEQDGGSSARIREILYSAAYKMFGENPFFGGGLGSFGIYYTDTDQRLYPHNIFLEVLGELGLVGCFALIILMAIGFSIGYKFIKKEEADHITLSIFLVTLYLFVNANVSGDLNDNRIFFAMLGVLFMVRSSTNYNNISSETLTAIPINAVK